MQKKMASRDDMSLLDVLSVLAKNNQTLLVGTIAGLTLAFGASQIITPQYEASTLLRIGHIKSVGQIEPTAVVMTRLKSRAFLQQVCALCDDSDLASFGRRVRVTQPPDTGLIKLVTRANTPEEAKVINQRILAVLQKAHVELGQIFDAELDQLGAYVSQTQAIQATFVSREPVFPKLKWMLLMGFLLGGSASAVWVLFRRAVRL